MLLWLKLIELNIGLVFLGATLIVLSAQSFKLFFTYFDKTKLSRFKVALWICVLVVFFLTSIVASMEWASATVSEVPDDDEMDALTWLAENVKDDAVVLAPVSEGFLISAIAQKKNVYFTQFHKNLIMSFLLHPST